MSSYLKIDICPFHRLYETFTFHVYFKESKMKSMMKLLFFLMVCFTVTQAQTNDTVSNKETRRPKYNVQQAFEIESLVPMFFFNGYHLAIGYRYERFRIRFSVINGGIYNAEPAGLGNSKDQFKRYYLTSPGVFAGYNIWKYWDFYAMLELHDYSIEQRSTGIKKNLQSIDYGFGIGYQYFIGDYFYIQPAIHLYLRGNHSINFNNEIYQIPRVDISPVLRLGVRLWEGN